MRWLIKKLGLYNLSWTLIVFGMDSVQTMTKSGKFYLLNFKSGSFVFTHEDSMVYLLDGTIFYRKNILLEGYISDKEMADRKLVQDMKFEREEKERQKKEALLVQKRLVHWKEIGLVNDKAGQLSLPDHNA